jgi:predicted transcriptional regulator of viral defense system
MQAINFLDKLRSLDLLVFTLVDAEQVLAKPKSYVRLYLHRLEKRKLILRIEKNKYSLKGINPLVIVTKLAKPSYISFLFALYTHHLTTQIPIKIQVVSPVSKKPLAFENYEFEFIKFPASKIFGYYKYRFGEGYAFLADKEKTVIDCLYLQKGVTINDINHAISSCDTKKLMNYAKRMDSTVLIQRLGYLLELNKKKVPATFNKQIGKNYALLNPLIPKKGIKNSKWKIIVNEVLE